MSDANRLWSDFLRVFVVVFILFAVFSFFSFKLPKVPVAKASETLLGVFVSLIGFLITAVTILFMFDSEKNDNLRRLKDAGYFPQIFERFVSTTLLLFFGIVLFLFVSLIDLSGVSVWLAAQPSFFRMAVSSNIPYFFLFVVLLVSLRLYRCLNVLHLMYQLVSNKAKPIKKFV